MTIPRKRADAEEHCWQAVLQRDAAADGTFVFAVRTTGIYCKPSCKARRPLRENVVFFVDGATARAAGFRACKRCRPEEKQDDGALRAQVVTAVCRWIDAAEGPPRLAELAARAGYSPFHLQRMFRTVLGTTPRAYAEARRVERLRTALVGGPSVTAAMHAAGYSSSSRLHAAAERSLGMTPSQLRRGAPELRIEYAVLGCTLGLAIVAATAKGLCAVLLGDDEAALRADLERRFARAQLVAGGKAFTQRVASVIACLDGEVTEPGLPLDVLGTAFQQRVWTALRTIPAGQTTNYTELAKRVGSPRGARAVAKACADNPLAIVVPCHRVVRSDGDLSGYRWGKDRKRALLARERGATQ
jgi:AraC family transcriptional regulator of adaptative response/methylated-DNA-[protein]-cysteine methyltransferase